MSVKLHSDHPELELGCLAHLLPVFRPVPRSGRPWRPLSSQPTAVLLGNNPDPYDRESVGGRRIRPEPNLEDVPPWLQPPAWKRKNLIPVFDTSDRLGSQITTIQGDLQAHDTLIGQIRPGTDLTGHTQLEVLARGSTRPVELQVQRGGSQVTEYCARSIQTFGSMFNPPRLESGRSSSEVDSPQLFHQKPLRPHSHSMWE